MKKPLKTKPVKTTMGKELLPQPAKPPVSDSSASVKGYNPTVLLRNGGEDYLKIDLWALALLYAPKEAMKNWNSLKLYLDGKEVGR